MKFRKRPRVSARELQILGLLALVFVIALLVLTGVNIALVRLIGDGGEFVAPWSASRGFLFEHTDPYSAAAAAKIQLQVYGRGATGVENPYFVTIPFFILPLYFPFALLSDPGLARSVWILLGEIALLGSALLSMALIEWQPSRLFLVFYSLLSICIFYSVNSFVEGTPGTILILLFMGILFCLYTGRDEAAGALLAFSLFYWEVTVLFVILIIWKALYDKRSRVFLGAGMLLSVLLITSLLVDPGWFFPFLIATLKMSGPGFETTSSAVWGRLLPGLGAQISWVSAVVVIFLLGYEWAATRGSENRRFVWAACLTLAATPLIGFHTNLSNLVLIFPSLGLIFAGALNRWRLGSWLTVFFYLMVLLVPWGLYARWYIFHDQRSWDLLFLFYPLVAIGGLYWIRWWFVRPPRTWLDQVRADPVNRRGTVT